ncbi:MAG: DUF1499 domain-containing protein [Myxococcota bacterium]
MIGSLLSGRRPRHLGVRDGKLAACPFSPNCVSSDARDFGHAVAPIRLDAPPSEAWQAAHDCVRALPRTELVAESEGYLHAECRSALLGFVDDLELHLRPDEGVIAVRSASRLGFSDLGVNRARVEDLRDALCARGVALPSEET